MAHMVRVTSWQIRPVPSPAFRTVSQRSECPPNASKRGVLLDSDSQIMES